MAPKELMALRLLMDNPRGLYGSELVHLSNGYLSRGTVYTLIDRLVEKGMVREQEEQATPELQLARTRHFITAKGQRSVSDYALTMGLTVAAGALQGGA